MTVTASSTPVDGSYRIYGIANNPSASALLGRRYFHDDIGAHWIGFDDNFAEPVVVRAYFDPTQDRKTRETEGLSYVGYMQFMRMSFRGMPIPPSVYGGILAQRQGYVYGDDQKMVDFMDPKSASVRNIPEPLYPWNGMLLTDTIRSVSDLFYQPLPNGSLCAKGALGPTQSLVASLAAEITASMVDEEVVENALSDDNLLVTITPASGQLATTEPYRIALTWLYANPLPGSPSGTPAFLAGLDESPGDRSGRWRLRPADLARSRGSRRHPGCLHGAQSQWHPDSGPPVVGVRLRRHVHRRGTQCAVADQGVPARSGHDGPG
jgi:hypothetical protein